MLHISIWVWGEKIKILKKEVLPVAPVEVIYKNKIKNNSQICLDPLVPVKRRQIQGLHRVVDDLPPEPTFPQSNDIGQGRSDSVAGTGQVIVTGSQFDWASHKYLCTFVSV